jgi:GNAT superfamily N-acetyltransferase
MQFDAALARRMLNNRNLRNAHAWADTRDLGGALALTSDAPIAALNCLLDFDAREAEVDALLDVGFGLLRAFDCAPAVEVTPLSRPKSLAQRLERRLLEVTERQSWMRFEGDERSIAVNPEVEVRVAGPDDVLAFGNVHGGSVAWVRRLSKLTTQAAMLEDGNTFYLGCVAGVTVGTLHLLIDGSTAGIYAVGTLRAYRKRGVSSTLMAAALSDAKVAGCELVCLATDTGGYAEGLYRRQGFEAMFESQLWTSGR